MSVLGEGISYVHIYIYVKVKVTQLCPTLRDPMDCSPPGSMGFSRQEYWNMSFGELWELLKDREAWRAVILGVEKSRTQLSN